MKDFTIFLTSFLLLLLLRESELQIFSAKKTKCLNPPRTARRVEIYINECQEEVKNKLIQEALEFWKEEFVTDKPPPSSLIYEPTEFKYSTHHNPNERKVKFQKRMANEHLQAEIYHPTLVPYEDKRIAGCLLHCVYEKNNAIDKLGWPTLNGLVNFYSEGANEHGFFMATLQAVDLCLKAVNRTQKNHCDFAFDVFDCISDQITGYCLDHYRTK